MQHQLVLQLRRGTADGEELIVALEAALSGLLGDAARLDGHDLGPRGINLFILSTDPASSFRRSKPALQQLQLLDRITAAHRLLGGMQFKTIWPLRTLGKFKLT